MIRSRTQRGFSRARAAAVVSAVAATSMLLPTGPADAQVPTGYMVLTGNFLGDARDEVFYYLPGTGPETMLGFSNDGLGTAYAEVVGQYAANGNYVPLVGDYDADGYEEILWFSPGTGGDSMWHFTGPETVQAVPYRINGTYSRPVVGDFTADGADDILWYAPGAYQDVMWDFNRGGGYSSTARTINGTYTPVSGSFGNDATDDILWYYPGATLDPLWDHVPGSTSYTQQVHNVRGNYTPVVVDMYGDGPGSEDIFWYGPGTYPDSTWDFLHGTLYTYADRNDGEYLVASGDLFGDGVEDLVFDNPSELLVWDHTPAVERIGYVWYPLAAASAESAERSGAPSAPVPTSPGEVRPGEPTGAEPLPRG